MSRTFKDYIDDFLIIYLISLMISLGVAVLLGLHPLGAFTLALVLAVPKTLLIKYYLKQEIIK